MTIEKYIMRNNADLKELNQKLKDRESELEFTTFKLKQIKGSIDELLGWLKEKDNEKD